MFSSLIILHICKNLYLKSFNAKKERKIKDDCKSCYVNNLHCTCTSVLAISTLLIYLFYELYFSTLFPRAIYLYSYSKYALSNHIFFFQIKLIAYINRYLIIHSVKQFFQIMRSKTPKELF